MRFPKIKPFLIRVLTAILPREWLRRVYIAYSAVVFQCKYGDYKFPRIFTIEISSHCNRACSYCPNIKYPQAARLIKDEVFHKIVDRLAEIRYNGVVDFIFFNEPTLNPKLPDYIRLVKAKVPSCIPRISTNGDFLTPELVTRLADAGIDRIYPMRHNPTPKGWRENIASLSEQFPGLFQPMDIDDCETNYGLHDFNGLVEVKRHRGRHLVNGKASCRVHRHIAQITIEGEWNLCCVDYEKTRQFGSLLLDPIMTIWRSSQFTAARNALEAGKPVSAACAKCTCLVERGDFKRPDFVSRQEAESLEQNQKPVAQFEKRHSLK